MAAERSRWWTLPERRPIATLAATVLACEVVGASGSVFTVTGAGSWYESLARPALAPPDWVFGPVWTTLFALMGVAAWLVWRASSGSNARAARVALGAFVVQFAFNVAWSAVFFGAQSIFGGLVVIAALWLAIVATVGTFYRVDRRAAALLLPYLAWVSFAGYLNYGIWVLN
jgi:tryptophan-rich sensory protein